MAFAAVSCHKDEPKPAPPMSPAEQQAKLNDAGVASIKEIDPDNWREFAETSIQLAQNFNYVNKGNYDELADQLERWFQAVQSGDGYETYVVTLQLSKLKGDCTIKNNVFHYTPSDNPLTLVYEFDGTWLSIDRQPVAYYRIGSVEQEECYAEIGYVPAFVNGIRANLILVFDHPDRHRQGRSDSVCL